MDWPVEAFIHNWTSYRTFFLLDRERGQPSMPRMISEGRIVKKDARLDDVKKEAEELLQKGPEPWSDTTIIQKRYFLTDALDDFIGCSDRGEGLFIAASLAEQASEFYLRINRQWTGSSKWMVRSLKNFNPDFAASLIQGLNRFYEKGEKADLVHVIEQLLHCYGGRLFDGFSIRKS
ncbi:hypothetical protein SAMN05192559_11036 [Halobacillus karajensis]|nr:hypothetical protein BN982_03803 [Halobacillus karajensis]CDQ29676.1 hypothetical protein BN981_04097 [Halobacillus karajensis]SEI07398.1 hypothetical protein SAMN05192559_11036 [Halobacillus karajensis]